ncbi:glycosyltransferase [uncultured Acinetobacter sp.]|uniref:glycosyltransferase family 2 protein n=1 Tax=uncultured Acinetobacter sp. TaxID=165433 RepID=UPI0025862635|nr:glycosyltransferase [uncultured Acinetobacter sp.]
MVKLSIIVPIYKVEKYIIECLESICCQLVDGIEVILVNDGTPDDSMILARNYISEKYSYLECHFVFIDQKNQGQSVARNNALKIAKGEYVGFLDSDDYLLPNYFNELMMVIEKENIEIIHFNAKEYSEAQGYIGSMNFVRENKISINDEFYREKLFFQAYWYPWLRVIKKDILCKFKFDANVYMEDKLLFPEIYNFENGCKIFEMKKDLICYRHREGSSIRSGYPEPLLNGIDLGIKKFIPTNKYPLYSIIYNQFLAQKISIMIDRGQSLSTVYSFVISEEANIKLNYRISYKIFLLKYFPFIYLVLLKLKKKWV